MVAAPFDTPSIQRVERWTRARRTIAEKLGAWAANAAAHDVRVTTPRSKRRGSAYRAGRADCWIKVKNPTALAVTREAEEDWNGKTNRKPGVNE